MTAENSTNSTVSSSDAQVGVYTFPLRKSTEVTGKDKLYCTLVNKVLQALKTAPVSEGFVVKATRRIMFTKMDDATVQAKVGEMVWEAESRIDSGMAQRLGLVERFNYDVSVEDYYENCSNAKVSIRGLKDSQVQYLLDLVEQMREEAKSVTQESVA